jgi:hypothetical protein
VSLLGAPPSPRETCLLRDDTKVLIVRIRFLCGSGIGPSGASESYESSGSKPSGTCDAAHPDHVRPSLSVERRPSSFPAYYASRLILPLSSRALCSASLLPPEASFFFQPTMLVICLTAKSTFIFPTCYARYLSNRERRPSSSCFMCSFSLPVDNCVWLH